MGVIIQHNKPQLYDYYYNAAVREYGRLLILNGDKCKVDKFLHKLKMINNLGNFKKSLTKLTHQLINNESEVYSHEKVDHLYNILKQNNILSQTVNLFQNVVKTMLSLTYPEPNSPDFNHSLDTDSDNEDTIVEKIRFN